MKHQSYLSHFKLVHYFPGWLWPWVGGGEGRGGWMVIIQYQANSVLNWTCQLELSLAKAT